MTVLIWPHHFGDLAIVQPVNVAQDASRKLDRNRSIAACSCAAITFIEECWAQARDLAPQIFAQAAFMLIDRTQCLPRRVCRTRLYDSIRGLTSRTE